MVVHWPVIAFKRECFDEKEKMNRILFTLIVLVLAAAAALIVLQFVMSLLGTILQVGVAGVIALLVASVVLRVVRAIAPSKSPTSPPQVLEPGEEVQHAVIERER
jgi:hypothetical protein